MEGYLYLAISIAGLFLGIVLTVVAFPFLMVSVCTGNPARGAITMRIGVGLTVVAVLASAFFLWAILLRQPISADYGDPHVQFTATIALLQALALLTCILAAVRHRHRARGLSPR